MTARQTKKWRIQDVVHRLERTEIVVCASPKATNVDLIAFARACVPSRALQTEWKVLGTGHTFRPRCGLTKGFLHYTLTIPRKESDQ